MINESFEIQHEAINKYGVDYENNTKFYTDVINDFKYINDFNKLLKKYLDDQVYVEYIPRKKNELNNYTIDKLIIELKPIQKKNI